MFPSVWLHYNKFSGKYFLVFGKEEGKHKSRPVRSNQAKENATKTQQPNHQRRRVTKTQQNASNQAKETKTQQKKMNQQRPVWSSLVDRLAMRSSGRSHRAISSIAPLVDRRAMRLSGRSHCAISSIVLVDRAARRRGAIVRRAAWSTIGALRSGLSLLLLSLWSGLSLLSLSLSFSGNELKWKWGWKIIPGQRWKFRSTGSYFPENEIYRHCQTPGFGGKWFPEIIFTQNKRTLKDWKHVFENMCGNTCR